MAKKHLSRQKIKEILLFGFLFVKWGVTPLIHNFAKKEDRGILLYFDNVNTIGNFLCIAISFKVFNRVCLSIA